MRHYSKNSANRSQSSVSKTGPRASDAAFRHMSREKKRIQRVRQKRHHRQNDIPEIAESNEIIGVNGATSMNDENTDDSVYLEALLNGQADEDQQMAKSPDQFSCRVRITPYGSDSADAALSAERTSLAPVYGVYPDDHALYNQSNMEYYDPEQRPIERRPSILQNPHVFMLTRSIGFYCGEKAKWIAEFLAARPSLLMVILVIVTIYFLLSLMEMSLVLLLDPVVRFLWTHLHWLLVMCGQGFRSVSNWFYTADHISDAWFCDFADAWCSRFNILCDRRCSHVDRALERLRPHD
ncbi:unnamed protein product, partial [Mesorhabditis belari]|uniref:Uncharacterized protein n=1 Tax=Mesorhabditis belari TaxID=2138241 RepID=A0AAF3FG71_9BILA